MKSDKPQTARHETLDRRYGAIGISAVAGALHCRGERQKNDDRAAPDNRARHDGRDWHRDD